MTWGNDPRVVRPVVGMMMRSRQAVVDYMTPLGLAHLMASGSSLRPGAVGRRPAGGRTGTRAIIIARTRAASASTAPRQRQQRRRAICAARSRHDSPTCNVGDDYLLWFHHVPWTYRWIGPDALGRARRTLRARRGRVEAMQREWQRWRRSSIPQRNAEVAAFLDVQHREANWWRDACIAYFQSLSHRPFPPGSRRPSIR